MIVPPKVFANLNPFHGLIPFRSIVAVFRHDFGRIDFGSKFYWTSCKVLISIQCVIFSISRWQPNNLTVDNLNAAQQLCDQIISLAHFVFTTIRICNIRHKVFILFMLCP